MKFCNGLSTVSGVVLASLIGLATASEHQFPFDGELILDVDPMRGSKRIPNMDVTSNGAISLEMWCNKIEGQFVVAADTVAVLTGQATARPCPP